MLLQQSSMRPEDRAPLKSVLNLSMDTLKELKLESLDPKKINDIRNMKFPEMKNDIILQLFSKNKINRIPVTLLKQSGRYLPEFKEVRKALSYFDLCDNPFGTCEVTLQALNRFKLDALTIFSDFLILPRAMGRQCEMNTIKGGYCLNPLESPKDIEFLKKIDIQSPILENFYNSIFLTRMALKGESVLMGFVGSAYTTLTFLLEKAPSKLYENTKKWLYSYPKETEELLNFINDSLYIHAIEQIKAGAQIINILDPNSNGIQNDDYENFSLKYSIELAAKIKERFPGFPINFYGPGQTGNYKEIFSKYNAFDAISVDFNVNNQEIKELAKNNDKILQGNLDTGILFGDKKNIEKKTLKMLESFKDNRYIANVGQGLWEEIDPNNVAIFVDTVKNFKLN